MEHEMQVQDKNWVFIKAQAEKVHHISYRGQYQFNAPQKFGYVRQKYNDSYTDDALQEDVMSFVL